MKVGKKTYYAESDHTESRKNEIKRECQNCYAKAQNKTVALNSVRKVKTVALRYFLHEFALTSQFQPSQV